MNPSFVPVKMTATLLGFLSVTVAASLDPPLNISVAQACVSPVPVVNTSCAGDFTRTSGPVAVNGTFTPVSGARLTASATGQSGFGVLKASASASFDITGTPKSAYVDGAAAFRDVLTIDFAPFDGSAGLLGVYYRLIGTTSSTGVGNAVLNVETYGGPTDSQAVFQNYQGSVSGFFAAPQAIDFVYGQPFDLGLELWAAAGTVVGSGNDGPNRTVETTGSGSGTADFSDTLVLSGLIPTDVNGNEAVGAQFSSASGTVYTTNGVVPEPGTTSLGFTGVCLILFAIRKKALSR